MTLNEYQQSAMTTCTESSKNFSYMMLNLVGEVGEFSSKVAKAIRKEEIEIGGEDVQHGVLPNTLLFTDKSDTVEMDDELMKEAGDILWQLSGLCSVMGWDLEDVAQMNLDKLASRKKRNVIVGDGDNR